MKIDRAHPLASFLQPHTCSGSDTRNTLAQESVHTAHLLVVELEVKVMRPLRAPAVR